MEARELVGLGAERIRGDSGLFTAYMEIYRDVFGSNAECSTCSFKRDFARLKRAVEHGVVNEKSKKKGMKPDKKSEEKTFVINKEGKIKSYERDGKVYRIYDTEMTEAFAVAYLTYGSAEEIERRKAVFRVLPLAIREPAKKVKNLELGVKS